MQTTEKQTQTITLNVKERMSLSRIIDNASTGFADQIILNAVKNEVSFDEKEVKGLSMRDVENAYGQVTTTWNSKKTEEFQKKLLLSKDRDRVLRKVIVKVCKQIGTLVDGFDMNIFNHLQWDKSELESLSKVVDEMDKAEKINQQNFDVCKAIKDSVENQQTTDAEKQ